LAQELPIVAGEIFSFAHPAAMAMARLMAVVLLGAVFAHGRLLGTPASAPPAPAAAELSDDEQIEALQNEISGAVSSVETAKKEAVTAGASEDEVMQNSIETFSKHCKPAERAALDKEPAEEPNQKEAAALDTGFAASLEATNRQSLIQNEEFLLGLLTMHQSRGDWLPEQYLDAVCSLANESPLITKLYKHHDPKKPLALQFALLMDEERKHMAPTRAPPMEEGPDAVKKLLAGLGAGVLVAKKAPKGAGLPSGAAPVKR